MDLGRDGGTGTGAGTGKCGQEVRWGSTRTEKVLVILELHA